MIIQVAVGVIVNDQGKVLVAERFGYLEQGDCWEFPGGKLEPGETAMDALRRELDEELGIVVTQAQPLLEIQHTYPDLAVHLSVFWVDQFTGDPLGKEGQQLLWLAPNALDDLQFPAANTAIVTAVQQRLAIFDYSLGG